MVSKKEKIQEILKQPSIKTLLFILVKWSNLTRPQMAKLINLSERQITNLLKIIDPKPYESEDKGLNLVVFKEYPYSSKRLYSATSYAQRRLGVVKGIENGNRIKLSARYDTKFNFYEVEHTDWCIKALLKEFDNKPFDWKQYLTAREIGQRWYEIYKDIKEIWHAGVEERKPDLLILNKDLKGQICIEVENTPKSEKRMRIVLRSLYALGDYAKRFKQVKIYANEKLPVYNKWKNLIPYIDSGDAPEHLEILKLHESLEKY